MALQHQNKIAENGAFVVAFVVLNAIAIAADIAAGGGAMTTVAWPFGQVVVIASATLSSVPVVATSLLVQLLYIASFVLLLKTYQDNQSQGTVFYAFASLGLASLFFVQIMFFVPVMWLLMGRNMMALTPRMAAASLLGLALPYWFALTYFVLTADLSPLTQHLAALGHMQPPGLAVATETTAAVARTLLFVLLTVAAALCTAYYLRNSHKDNINVRMRIEMTIGATLATVVAAALQPCHLPMLLGMMTVTTSALIAHDITLYGSPR